MQKLLLTEHVYDQLQKGKSVTIRKGNRNILLNKLIFESVEKQRITIVNVKKVIHCRLGDVPEEYYIKDGFTSILNMHETLKEFYPDITLKDEVTIIEFVK